MTNPPLVALTTDFGELDGYVAQMKGVVLVATPRATLVDVTHDVPPQDVPRAAALLDDVVEAFPARTIHVVVVDPGVGTPRPIVAVEAAGQRFVAPDNGVLSHVVERFGATLIVECTNPEWWRPNVSNTFHGRDVMAPLAAHWANGADPLRFGERRDGLAVRLPPSIPDRRPNGLDGRVLWADRFGNLVTNVRSTDLPDEAADVRVRLDNHDPLPLHRTYGEVDPAAPLALVGSNGRVEIAVNGGSAAERFAWHRGTETAVTVTWTE